MNDEQFFLANAYLDGELTAAERAIAESDPEVMAEVEELRALQGLLRQVDPPSDATRAAAISAAMAEFSVAPARSDRPPAPAPIPFRPRPSYAKYLAVAAGVLGVGVLGVAIANLDTGGDDSTMDSAEPASEEPADEPAEDRATEAADVLADDDAADDATSEIAPGEPTIAAADEPANEEAADEPASEEPAEEPADAPADEPASDGGIAERPVVADGQLLTTPEELGSYGTGLLEDQRAGTLGATPNHACPIESVLGRADYLLDDVVVPILVAVDEPAGVVSGFADDTCEPVADGPLYLP